MVPRHAGWLLAALVPVSATPSSCERRPAGPPALPEIVIGEKTSSVITSADRQCAASFAPCRVFQVAPVRKAGVLRVTLRWTNTQNGLRLELWNGNDGDGICCRTGESVALPISQGDRAEIEVTLTGLKRKSARQAFELRTSIQEALD
jgi:hypothetical protein